MGDDSVRGMVRGNPVTLLQGDIAAVEADAVLVPEFDRGASYGGVGGALARAGCIEGLEAFGTLAEEKGPLAFGTVILTPSGGGASPNLVHAVSAGAPPEHQFAVAKAAMSNALHLAQRAGLRSLAVPALCTGIIGALTGEQSAQAMLAAIDDYAREGGTPVDVTVVTFRSPSTHADFAEVLENGSYAHAGVSQPGRRPFDLARWDIEMSLDTIANARAFGGGPSVH